MPDQDEKPIGPLQPFAADDEKPLGPVQPLAPQRPIPTPQTVPMVSSHSAPPIPLGMLAASHGPANGNGGVAIAQRMASDALAQTPKSRGITLAPPPNPAVPASKMQSYGTTAGIPIGIPSSDEDQEKWGNRLYKDLRGTEQGPGPITRTVQSLNQQAEVSPDAPIARRIGAGITRGVVSTLGFIPETAESILRADTPGGAAVEVGKRTIDPQVAEYQKAKQEAEQGNTSQSMGHSVAAAIPFVGPLAAGIGERAGTGDVAGATAEGLTYALAPKAIETVKGAPFEAPNTQELQSMGSAALDATKKVGNVVTAPVRLAQRIVNPADIDAVPSFIKGTKPRNTVSDIQGSAERGLPYARRAADTLGLDPDDESFGHQEALHSIIRAKQDIWNQLNQDHLIPASTSIRDVDAVGQKISKITDGMSDIAKRREPGLVDAIADSASDYLGKKMPVQDIEQRIQELNNDLSSQQSKLKVQQDVLRKDPAYAYKFAELESLRSTLNDALDEVTGPGARELKQRYGDLKKLQDVTERSRNVADRQSPVGLFEGAGKVAGLGNMAGGVWATVLGHPAEGVSQIAKGAMEANIGRNIQRANNRNYMVRQAFRKTEPASASTPSAEYMPEPGASSPLVPRFGQRQLGPMTRERGVPESPNVDQVDNREHGSSVTPVGPAGRDGVLLRPAGLLPEAHFPGETPEPRPLRIGGRVPPDNSRALPPISLPESHETPSNLEAVGVPETAEESALRNAIQQGRGRFGTRVSVARTATRRSKGGVDSPPFEQLGQAPQEQSSVAIDRNPQVPPEKQALEDEAIRYTQQNLPALVDEYTRRNTSKDGMLTIDADNAKAMLPQYGTTLEENAANTTAVHKSSTAIARKVMDQALAQPIDPNKPQVTFVTGIPGAGKSFGSEESLPQTTGIERQGILDDFPSASAKIDQVLASGRDPAIHAVMVKPMVAFERTVTRAIEEGRIVPMDSVAEAAKGIVPTLKQIASHYGPDVKIQLVDNSVNWGRPTPISLNDLDNYAYNGDAKELANEFRTRLDELHDSGKVPDSTYQAILRGARAEREGVHAGLDGKFRPETGGEEGGGAAPPIKSGPETPPMPPTPGGNRVSGERVPVSTAKIDKAYESGEQIAGTNGGDTSLLTSSGKLPARYRIVDASDLKPSHDAMTFAKNPDYPEGVQERAYHTSKEAQNRVIQQSQNYDPAYTVNSNPDAVNGPPIITPDGTVLGGNSRAMSTQRIYRADAADGYRDYLRKSSGAFGFTPDDVDSVAHPVLVREVPAPATIEETRRLGSELNKSMTGALGVSEKAVSAGKSITPETLNTIGTMLDAPDTTLRSVMAAHGSDFIKMLTEDGVITDRERPAFVDTATGGLSDEGKTFIERALRGFIVDDPDLMDSTPKSVLNKLDGSLADAVTLGQRTDEYNILPLLREALSEHGEIARKGTSVAMYYGEHIDKNFGKVKQESIFPDEKNPAVKALVQLLGDKQAVVRSKIRQFTQDAKYDQPGQGMLMMGEQPSAANAFNDAFGTSFSDEQFGDALKKAYERHAGGSTIPTSEASNGNGKAEARQNLRTSETPSEGVRRVSEGDAPRTAARRTDEDGTKTRLGVRTPRTGKRT